jgi:hypothetical protein
MNYVSMWSTEWFYVYGFLFLCHVFHVETKNGSCFFIISMACLILCLCFFFFFMSCISFRNKSCFMFFPFLCHAWFYVYDFFFSMSCILFFFHFLWHGLLTSCWAPWVFLTSCIRVWRRRADSTFLLVFAPVFAAGALPHDKILRRRRLPKRAALSRPLGLGFLSRARFCWETSPLAGFVSVKSH